VGEDAAQVRVPGGDAVLVTDLHQISIPTGPSGADDRSLAGRDNRRAGTGGVIGAFMLAGAFPHRVGPRAREVRRDPAEFVRGAQEGALERIAVFVVEMRCLPLFFRKPERGELTVVD